MTEALVESAQVEHTPRGREAAGIMGQLDRARLPYIVLHQARMHALEVRRILVAMKGEGGTLRLPGESSLGDRAYGVDLMIQLAIEFILHESAHKSRMSRDARFRQRYHDALYFPSRMIAEGKSTLDLRNASTLASYLDKRAMADAELEMRETGNAGCRTIHTLRAGLQKLDRCISTLDKDNGRDWYSVWAVVNELEVLLADWEHIPLADREVLASVFESLAEDLEQRESGDRNGQDKQPKNGDAGCIPTGVKMAERLHRLKEEITADKPVADADVHILLEEVRRLAGIVAKPSSLRDTLISEKRKDAHPFMEEIEKRLTAFLDGSTDPSDFAKQLVEHAFVDSLAVLKQNVNKEGKQIDGLFDIVPPGSAKATSESMADDGEPVPASTAPAVIEATSQNTANAQRWADEIQTIQKTLSEAAGLSLLTFERDFPLLAARPSYEDVRRDIERASGLQHLSDEQFTEIYERLRDYANHAREASDEIAKAVVLARIMGTRPGKGSDASITETLRELDDQPALSRVNTAPARRAAVRKLYDGLGEVDAGRNHKIERAKAKKIEEWSAALRDRLDYWTPTRIAFLDHALWRFFQTREVAYFEKAKPWATDEHFAQVFGAMRRVGPAGIVPLKWHASNLADWSSVLCKSLAEEESPDRKVPRWMAARAAWCLRLAGDRDRQLKIAELCGDDLKKSEILDWFAARSSDEQQSDASPGTASRPVEVLALVKTSDDSDVTAWALPQRHGGVAMCQDEWRRIGSNAISTLQFTATVRERGHGSLDSKSMKSVEHAKGIAAPEFVLLPPGETPDTESEIAAVDSLDALGDQVSRRRQA